MVCPTSVYVQGLEWAELKNSDSKNGSAKSKRSIRNRSFWGLRPSLCLDWIFLNTPGYPPVWTKCKTDSYPANICDTVWLYHTFHRPGLCQRWSLTLLFSGRNLWIDITWDKHKLLINTNTMSFINSNPTSTQDKSSDLILTHHKTTKSKKPCPRFLHIKGKFTISTHS